MLRLSLLLAVAVASCHGVSLRNVPTAAPSRSLRQSGGIRSRSSLLLASVVEASQDVIKKHVFPSGSKVLVCSSPEGVERVVCGLVQEKTTAAVAKNGHCNVAVAGGSILKTLAATKDKSKYQVPFDKMHLAYVNHKCVALDDKDSTHFKATELFIKESPPASVIAPLGTTDGAKEAAEYEKELRKLCDADKLPVNSQGYPVFDLLLLGMGDDGHMGSLHPNRPEILHKGSEWVLSAVKDKPPASITFSLNVMNSAECVIISMSGEKKAAAVKKALEGKDAPGSFPVQMLAPPNGVTFVCDEAAAKDLTI